MLAALRRYALGVIVATLLGGLVAYVLALQQPVLYESDTTVFLNDPNTRPESAEVSFQDPGRFVRNSVDIALSNRVARDAYAVLGSTLEFATFRERYDVEASALDRDSFVVRASASTPQQAVDFVDALVTSYRGFALLENTRGIQELLDDYRGRLQGIEERQVQLRAEVGLGQPTFVQEQQLEQIAAELAGVDAQIALFENQIETIGDGVRFVDSAELPLEPVQPQPVLTAMAGMLTSFVVATAIAWWRMSASQVVTDRNEAAKLLHAPLLGEVPDFSGAGIDGVVPAATAPFSGVGEAYQFIVSSLLYTLRENQRSVVLLTSAAPGDGKSITALNLAIAAGRDEQRVVLLDADARVRGLSRLCEVDGGAGLADIADERLPLQRGIVTAAVGDERVEIVPMPEDGAGQASFFRTSDFRAALNRLRQAADLVLIDSPPLLAVAETSAIAGQVDGLVLVVARGTSHRALDEVAQQLDFIGTPLLGYIFNRSRSRRGGSAYRYGYGYHETSEPVARGRRRLSRPRAS